MEAPADTQPQMDAPIELQQAIDTSAEIPPTNPPMEIQKPMEAPTASPHIKDSLEETTKTIDALANSSEPINGPQQMLVVAAKANQEQTTRILPEQASSSSTSALEVKSNDQDIESDALDQQDKKAIETTIVSTSLVSITNDLDGFQSVSWIVTSYLVTYTGFLAIISKMSDIFGRKSLKAISFGLFVLFSLGCGLAQTMNQLIILRAFQGIGGGGIYAMAYVIFPDISTPEMYGGYAAYLSLMATPACLLGPLFGGAINDNTTWRWVFWINVPIGLVCLIIVLLAIPRNFPHPPHNSPLALPRQALKQKLGRRDAIGTFFLLAASVTFDRCTRRRRNSIFLDQRYPTSLPHHFALPLDRLYFLAKTNP
ncbi:MAG: hypothetical protein GOMPHAMPRED_003601 [Gomphillus americanus]|uniref:Major facilitator superfamily (MFS) profile domain-containing protein n=1 Tax=Gomphillus americanus TaxID=1940652 RepID=A0A8H3IR58_9LECA|nr:MAG: hypothetical protein GOMPHAMPRED_003601 [Gomphillus americanus]